MLQTNLHSTYLLCFRKQKQCLAEQKMQKAQLEESICTRPSLLWMVLSKVLQQFCLIKLNLSHTFLLKLSYVNVPQT